MKPIAILFFSFFLTAGALAGPFPKAKHVASFTPQEFESKILEEKKQLVSAMEDILKSEEEGIFTLLPFRELPTLKQWRKLKEKMIAGDMIWEFRHEDDLKYYEQKPSVGDRTYVLMRGKKRVAKIHVRNEPYDWNI